MRRNGAVGNLNGVKPYERVVKCSWVKFKWEEVKCRQVLSSGVKVLGTVVYHYSKIYRPYKVSLLLSCSFGSIVFHCIYGCMFCMLLFKFVYYYCYVYVFLFYMFRFRYCVSLCCSVYCLCVNVYCTSATGCQPSSS